MTGDVPQDRSGHVAAVRRSEPYRHFTAVLLDADRNVLDVIDMASQSEPEIVAQLAVEAFPVRAEHHGRTGEVATIVVACSTELFGPYPVRPDWREAPR